MRDARRTPAVCLDLLIEALLVCLLAFAPFAFGAVEPWAEAVVVCGGAAVAVCLAARILVTPRQPMVWTWAYIPIVLFIGLALLQITPVPRSVIAFLSPEAVNLRADLLGSTPGAAGNTPWTQLSLYPYATRHNLRLVLTAAAVFLAVVNVVRRPEQIRRILVAVVVVGGAAAALALAQDLTKATNIYWTGPAGKEFATAGPFVHYGHYGQFGNIVIGAALGLLLTRLHPTVRRRRGARREQGRTGRAAATGWATFVLALTATVAAVTVLLSGSRAAVASMLAAGLFVAACVARSRAMGGRGWLAVPVIALLVGAGLAFGSGAVFERLGTLESSESYAARLLILKSLTAVWAKFPVVGTGLGTHETVYPMFNQSTRFELVAHAENEYAQVLEEMGIGGLLIVLAFAAVIWANVLRTARRGRPPIRLAAIGVGFALAATMVHSLADFGQHIPANLLLMAVCCGLAVSLRRVGSAHRGERRAERPEPGERLAARGPARGSIRLPWRLGTGAVAALVAVVASAWMARGATAAGRAQANAGRALELTAFLARPEADEGDTNADYARAISFAAAACELEPDNVKHRYLLNAARWQAISRVRDPETGAPVFTAESREHAARIADDLRTARSLCPTFGRLYSLAGQVRLFVLNDAGGADDIAKASRLSQYDPLATYLSAQLHAAAGRWDAAVAEMTKGMRIGVAYDGLADICLSGGKVDLALTLAGSDDTRLSSLAAKLERDGARPDLAADLRRRAADRLTAEASAPDAPIDVVLRYADALAGRGEYDQAAEFYRRAIARDYGQPDRHLTLARTLAASGRYVDAMRSVKACLTLRPADANATQLLAEYEKTLRLSTTQPAAN